MYVEGALVLPSLCHLPIGQGEKVPCCERGWEGLGTAVGGFSKGWFEEGQLKYLPDMASSMREDYTG